MTDPRQWDATAWVSDAAPHLAFGMARHATRTRSGEVFEPTTRALAVVLPLQRAGTRRTARLRRSAS